MPRIYRIRYCCKCKIPIRCCQTCFLCDECIEKGEGHKTFVSKPIYDNVSGFLLPVKFDFT